MVELPHKVGATFLGTSLSKSLWPSVKDALERVMHHEAELEAFSGPFPHKDPAFLEQKNLLGLKAQTPV